MSPDDQPVRPGRALWTRYLFLFCALKYSASAQTLVPRPEPNTTIAADAVITFNEIMYHPLGENTLEWVELYNQIFRPKREVDFFKRSVTARTFGERVRMLADARSTASCSTS